MNSNTGRFQDETQLVNAGFGRDVPLELRIADLVLVSRGKTDADTTDLNKTKGKELVAQRLQIRNSNSAIRNSVSAFIRGKMV